MQLPPNLRQILSSMTETVSTAVLSRAAVAVSERYRRVKGAGPLAITSEDEAMAYLAVRFPATFCAAASVLEKLPPGFAPVRMLDIGAGPGTAALAAMERWESLQEISLVEPNAHLRKAGAALLREKRTQWHAGSVEKFMPEESGYDLVMSGYVLNEIEDPRETVRKMWRAAKDALVIIEPGTPAGQEIILRARDILIAEGAFIAAPCPHMYACPLAGSEKWCHFSVRVERSRTHRSVKQDAVLPYEDEKFSYLVAVKDKPVTPKYRVIGHPRGTKVIDANVCTAAGAYETLRVAKSAPDYKAFRKAAWGDGISSPSPALAGEGRGEGVEP